MCTTAANLTVLTAPVKHTLIPFHNKRRADTQEPCLETGDAVITPSIPDKTALRVPLCKCQGSVTPACIAVLASDNANALYVSWIWLVENANLLAVKI